MVYTVIINDRSYDLPSKTLKVVEEMERVSKIDEQKGLSIREKYKKLYGFIVGLVGTENANEILGSDNIDEVDLCEVTLTFKKIMDAYDKPLEEYQSQQIEDKLRQLPMDQVSNITGALNDLASSNLVNFHQ